MKEAPANIRYEDVLESIDWKNIPLSKDYIVWMHEVLVETQDSYLSSLEALKTARELNQELRDTMWHQKGCMEAELKSLKETIKGDTSDINNLRNYIRDQELYVARMEGYLTRIQDQEGSNKDAVIGRHALSSQDVAEDYKASIPLTQRYGPRKWFEVK